MVNSLVIQGRLTKDPVNKNGNAYFGIAYTDYKNETMFLEVVAFGKNAEYCLNFLRKGNMVIVEGALKISKYQDKLFTSCVSNRVSNIGASSSNNETIIVKEEVKKEETPVATDEDIDIDDSLLPF